LADLLFTFGKATFTSSFSGLPGKLSNYESEPLKSMLILENFVAGLDARIV